MVGLLPLCAATVLDGEFNREVPRDRGASEGSSSSRLELWPSSTTRGRPATRAAAWRHPGRNEAPPRAGENARRRRVPQPLRAAGPLPLPCRAPVRLPGGDQEYRVTDLPAESSTGMFGGNSNWRGPTWMPVNALISGLGAILRLLR